MLYDVIRLLCAAALIASTWSGGAVAYADTGQWRETRRLCPALRNVDFARLNADAGDDWRGEARRMLRATDRPELGDADLVLRFYASPGFGGTSSTWTTARRVAGAWRVEREDRPLTSAGPPAYDPFRIDMRASRPRSPIILREGPLDPAFAGPLEAALSDPCLDREPDTAPAALPLRGGRLDLCMDGAPFYLQIERATGVRTFVHVCEPRWRAGEIMRILETAPTVVEQSTISNALTPLILVDTQGRNVPEAEAPGPVTLSITGALGVRAVRLEVNGDVVYDAVPPATPIWTIWQPIGDPAPSYQVSVAGCTTSVDGALPAPGGTISIAVTGCRLHLSETTN